jgi:K+-transporting ATPase ATPase C chain
MNAHVRANLWLLALTLVLCCVAYPLLLWGVGQGVFPEAANGSLILKDGKVVGSRLIAQPFTGEEWFWPRPSAVGYNAAASGGSNLGANNPKLRERVAKQLAEVARSAGQGPVPADLVMASGSGLDPHITLRAAQYQVERVAVAWARRTGVATDRLRDEIQALLSEKAVSALGGLVGEPLVNVLEVNIALAVRLRQR